MTKTVLLAATLVLSSLVLPAHSSERKKSSSSAKAKGSTEVRYTVAPSNRKAPRLQKLIISRDSSGRVISVKRG